jgi:hypothetical protein
VKTIMNTNTTKHSLAAYRLGFVSSLTLGALFVLYIFCFVGILGHGPLFVWTNLQDFIAYSASHDQTLKYLAYGGMLVFCAAWVVLCQCIGEAAGADRKLYARVGAAFGALFALASGSNYFVQLTAVRLNLMNGTTAGLEQWVMGNPLSAIAAVNMLGWTVLLGLSSLFLALAFDEKARAARFSLLANGVVCLIAAVGFVLNNTILIAICMYPLLGGAVLFLSVSLSVLFVKKKKMCNPAHIQGAVDQL